jgi:hypothetical protein
MFLLLQAVDVVADLVCQVQEVAVEQVDIEQAQHKLL